MPRAELAQFLEELDHGFAVESFERAFMLLLLVGQDVRGFDEAFDGEGLGFEATVGDCVGDGGGDKGFAAAGAAGEGDEGAAVGGLLGV